MSMLQISLVHIKNQKIDCLKFLCQTQIAFRLALFVIHLSHSRCRLPFVSKFMAISIVYVNLEWTTREEKPNYHCIEKFPQRRDHKFISANAFAVAVALVFTAQK